MVKIQLELDKASDDVVSVFSILRHCSKQEAIIRMMHDFRDRYMEDMLNEFKVTEHL